MENHDRDIALCHASRLYLKPGVPVRFQAQPVPLLYFSLLAAPPPFVRPAIRTRRTAVLRKARLPPFSLLPSCLIPLSGTDLTARRWAAPFLSTLNRASPCGSVPLGVDGYPVCSHLDPRLSDMPLRFPILCGLPVRRAAIGTDVRICSLALPSPTALFSLFHDCFLPKPSSFFRCKDSMPTGATVRS